MEAQPNPQAPALTSLEPEYIVPAGMSQVQFPAMGTRVTVLLPTAQLARGAAITQALFMDWEQTLSRFRADSELAQLNQQTGRAVPVSALLFSVLLEALTAAQATDGIYDPTLLQQLTQLGYDRTFTELPAALPVNVSYRAQLGGAWRNIEVEPKRRSVRLPSGVQLDFGGIAKGMAVDAALERLQQAGIHCALVNAGGDLAVQGLPPAADAWSIAIPGKDLFWSLPLTQGAVATSGIARRHWWQGQTLRHHLLDPRTGLPVENGLWSVSVVAGRCAQAEVAAKVAFILVRYPETGRGKRENLMSHPMPPDADAANRKIPNMSNASAAGKEQGQLFLAKYQLAGLFIDHDGTWETGGGWPVDLMRRLP